MAAVCDKIYPLLGAVLLMWLSYAAIITAGSLLGEICDAYLNVND